VPTATWQRLEPKRRDAVVAAAEAEFARHGFSGGSLNVIAREAGVSKGSLFQYFTDKVDLYAHLSELASDRIREAMVARLAELPWSTDYFGSLRDLALFWVRYFSSHPLELALTAAVNLEPDVAARSAVRGVANDRYLEVLRPLLELGRDSGQLRPDADLDAFLALLLLLLPHLALAPHTPGLDPVFDLHAGQDDVLESTVDRLLTVFEDAFAAR
jgi:AcrR family transcriptional regulator